MAKPIKETPVLYGDDARRFIKSIRRREMNELGLPWKDNVGEVVDAGGDIVMDGYCGRFQGHIDFILKAVNNHDALVEVAMGFCEIVNAYCDHPDQMKKLAQVEGLLNKLK